MHLIAKEICIKRHSNSGHTRFFFLAVTWEMAYKCQHDIQHKCKFLHKTNIGICFCSFENFVMCCSRMLFIYYLLWKCYIFKFPFANFCRAKNKNIQGVISSLKYALQGEQIHMSQHWLSITDGLFLSSLFFIANSYYYSCRRHFVIWKYFDMEFKNERNFAI